MLCTGTGEQQTHGKAPRLYVKPINAKISEKTNLLKIRQPPKMTNLTASTEKQNTTNFDKPLEPIYEEEM